MVSKCGDDTKLRGAVDCLRGRESLQKYLHKAEDLETTDYMKFNKDKCWTLHLGWVSSGRTDRQTGE